MLRRFGLAAFGVVVALVAVEIVLRAVFSPADIGRYVSPPTVEDAARWADHPFLPFVGRPDAEYVANVPAANTRVVVRNNSFGFRSHEFPRSKSPEDYFIVALGESTTWGAAAETNASTWPELLEARLRERHPERNVRVFNLGTQNATVAYNVVVLGLIGIHIRPDLVLVYHGYNDGGPATAFGFRMDHAHYFRNLALEHRWHGFQRSLPRGMLSSYAVAYLTSLMDETIGANRLGFYVARIMLGGVPNAERYRAELLRNWAHLLTIDSIARGHGAATLFSTFQFYEGDRRFHRLTNETLREVYETHGLRYVDVDAAIPDYDRSLQFDECHFTPAGEELMARTFFDKIVAEGFLNRDGIGTLAPSH